MPLQTYTCTIITLSDRASEGVYEDISGRNLEQSLNEYFDKLGCTVFINREIIPDEPLLLKTIIETSIKKKTDFIFTTGGTGIGPRDITPDIVKPLLTKEIPGIMEVIRVKYALQFASAALSRSIAGVANNSLVYCLPGSPKAVTEYMEEILKTMLHCHRMLHGSDKHSG